MILGRRFRRRPEQGDLSAECAAYLKKGPPQHMDSYVPGSITEMIIGYGAQRQELDEEMTELASIVLMESDGFTDIQDPEIRSYMMKGAELVSRVLDRYGA